MQDQPVEIEVIGSLDQIDAADWDACACPEAADGGAPHDPFTTHRFLSALEHSGSVGRGTGWQPQHITFCTEAEAQAGAQMGLMARSSQQFHWVNNGYEDFEAFLASLSSRKRKAIRKERAGANGFGGQIEVLTGDQIEPEHWDAFWQFYQDTGARKWGTPYLTRAFFDIAHDSLRDDMVLVLAQTGGRYVGGALNFIGRETLYGRYWGCTEHHPFLHFELCYYRAIEEAIMRGLKRVEAGAQGEHKLARGYLPVVTHSLHWVGDAGFREAIARYLEAERDAVEQDIEILTDYGPFRKIDVEEHQ